MAGSARTRTPMGWSWCTGWPPVGGRRGAPAGAGPRAFRVHTPQEYASLGAAAIGFIASLDRDRQLSPVQREIVIERAAALAETPIALERVKIIVLMVLWS